jgi:peptidoglycan/xylan/chitin deacetylase (PgdA/CDA1 family)
LAKNGSNILRRPIPDRLVVLTFDDAVSNHATCVAPLLKRYGFGATFFVCEFPPDFATNKVQYMTWEQIKSLHDDRFEIGNHTGHHCKVVKGISKETLVAELEYIENRCQEYGITKPTSFCYPGGGAIDLDMLPVLTEKGYLLARIAQDRVYRPAVDHPLLVPSFVVHGDSEQAFFQALPQAQNGQIVVLTFHGVPEYTHPWVNTPVELFERYMRHLHDKAYTVIAMRDLLNYIDPALARLGISHNQA